MRFAMILIAATLAAQTRSPQFEIIPYSSGTQGIMRFLEQRPNGTNHIQFRAPASLAANFDLRWPVPVANSIWYTDSALFGLGNTSTFVFDAATGRLGVGTATPAQRIDAGSGSIRGGAYVFETGSTYSIGSSGNRAANIFTEALNITDPPTGGVIGNLIGITDATYDLGTLSRRWRNGYFSSDLRAGTATINGDTVTGSLRSLLPSTYSLGTNSNRWANTFTDYLTLTSTAGFGVVSNFMPAADNLYTLGGVGYRWSTANIAGTVTTGNVVSQSPSTHSLGTSGNRWTNGFFDTLTLSNGAGQGFASHVVPISNFVWTLGNSSYRWDILWGRFANMRSSGATLAGFSMRDAGDVERAYIGESGGFGGEMRINDGAGFEVFGVVGGNIRASGLNGITKTITVSCGTITITKGIITATTCP